MQPFRVLLRATLPLLTLLMLTASATAQDAPPDMPLDAETRAAVVEELAMLMAEYYVEPQLGEAMGNAIREQLAAGGYDDVTDLMTFAQRLGQDMRTISDDSHLSIDLAPPMPPGGMAPPPVAQMREQMSRGNFGFREVARLVGNIAYIDIEGFMPLMLNDEPVARDAAAAVMAMVQGADAIIFDLRSNNGGTPTMVQFLQSYLFGDEPVHLNSISNGIQDSVTEFWTLEDIPGERMPNVPVYVLTSGYSVSAAEEFAYNLQALERGVIIGETTGGAANLPGGFPLRTAPLLAYIPVERSINPITGTNWEGTGVLPDIAVPANEALAVAHEMALESLVAEGGVHADERALALEITRALVNPTSIDVEVLERYAGTYDRFTVEVRGGRLFMGEALVALGSTTFAPPNDTIRLEFDVQADGTVVGLWLSRPGGQSRYLPRAS